MAPEKDNNNNGDGDEVEMEVGVGGEAIASRGEISEKEEEGNSDTEKNESTETIVTKLIDFYWKYEFLCLILVVILLARAYPKLGAVYFAPQITATWIAVVFIFVLAGLGLKTEEFKKALRRVHFNAFVQIYNFGVVSSIGLGFSRLMVLIGILPQSLADGIAICCCLPLTINMVLVLTKNSGGDEASAIFNAAFGNMIGVFLSPILILGYIGVTGDVDLAGTFYKLALRVVLPIAFGQLLQKFSKPVVAFVKKHKPKFKKAQTYALVFIVYTVFCKTFKNGSQSGVGHIFLMVLFQFIILVSVMALAWILLRFLFPLHPTLRVMGLYGCTHKTVAMGVPLINAIYEDNENVGLYTLPLLVYHPMQLVIGSFLAPRLQRWVQQEKERLGIVDDEAVAADKISKENIDEEEAAPAIIEKEEEPKGAS